VLTLHLCLEVHTGADHTYLFHNPSLIMDILIVKRSYG